MGGGGGLFAVMVSRALCLQYGAGTSWLTVQGNKKCAMFHALGLTLRKRGIMLKNTPLP